MRASRDYTAEPTFKLTQFALYDAHAKFFVNRFRFLEF